MKKIIAEINPSCYIISSLLGTPAMNISIGRSDMFNVFRRNYGKTQLCALTSITPKMQFELTIFALIDQENGKENMYVILYKGSQGFLHTFNMASYY
mgnify:CR=1 FL=1